MKPELKKYFKSLGFSETKVGKFSNNFSILPYLIALIMILLLDYYTELQGVLFVFSLLIIPVYIYTLITEKIYIAGKSNKLYVCYKGNKYTINANDMEKQKWKYILKLDEKKTLKITPRNSKALELISTWKIK